MFGPLIQEAAAYPHLCLPEPMLNAVDGVWGITRAPIPLIAASALGALATACQGIANVERPMISKPIPLSLNLLTVAESGERKSAADHFFFAPIAAFDQMQRARNEAQAQLHGADLAIWNAKKNGLQQRIRKSTLAGHDTAKLETELHSLHQNKPSSPEHIRVLLSDITPAALADALGKNPCSAALHSNEAADLISGRALSNLAMLNRLWDGQTLEIDRKDTSLSFQVENARLSTTLAVQPDKFKTFCERGHARHSGFLARTLISHPASNAGRRKIDHFDFLPELNQNISCFQQQITRLMSRAFDRHRNGWPRTILKFSPNARGLWIDFFNKIEERLYPGVGDLVHSKDFAAKAAEHAARIAALFQLLRGGSMEVSSDSVERAILLVSWYVGEFDRLLGETQQGSDIHKNAMQLLAWLKERSAFNKFQFFSRREILQYGPKPVRRLEALEPVLNYLAQQGEIVFSVSGNKAARIGLKIKIPDEGNALNLQFNHFTPGGGLVHSDVASAITRQFIGSGT